MSLPKNVLSLDNKIEIISSIEAEKKLISVSKELRFPQTTVNSLGTRTKRILEIYENNEVPGSRKPFRESKHPELESVLLWLKQVQDQNSEIGGLILKMKGKDFAKEIGIVNFFCSEDWLSRLKEQHTVISADYQWQVQICCK